MKYEYVHAFWDEFHEIEIDFRIRYRCYFKLVFVGVLDMVLPVWLFFSSIQNFDSQRDTYNTKIGRSHILDRVIFDCSKYDVVPWARNGNRTHKKYIYYIFQGSSWSFGKFYSLLGKCFSLLSYIQKDAEFYTLSEFMTFLN